MPVLVIFKDETQRADKSKSGYVVRAQPAAKQLWVVMLEFSKYAAVVRL